MKKYTFSDRSEFIQKLVELLESGVSPKKMQILLPHADHEVDEIMSRYVPSSKLKLFTLLGTLSGCSIGFGFTIYTVKSWPLITGGKPLISIPAFIVIAFELTILFGALVSFFGFTLLAKLPNFKRMITPLEYGNQFVITIDGEDR